MRILTLAAAALIAGCATAPDPQQAPSADIKPTVNIQGGAPQFSAALKSGQPVAVEFVNSPKLGTAVQRQLAAVGAKVDSNGASLELKAQAGYSFVRPQERKVHVDLGQAIETSKAGVDLEETRRLAERSGGSVGMASTVEVARGNMMPSVALAGGVIEAVFNLSGARAGINRSLVGDSRGICLGTAEQCSDWKKYTQEVRVLVELSTPAGKETVTGIASVKDPTLRPELLFEAALAAAMQQVVGGSQ